MWIKVQSIINHWRLADTVSALDIDKMLGTIQYMAPLVPRGRLRFWPIQWWASEDWDQTSENWAQVITVPDWIIHNLSWWASHSVSQLLSLKVQGTDFTMFTDVSTDGWGAQLGDHSIGGQWSKVLHQNHINILEMEVVYCAVYSFLNWLHGHVVQLCIYFMFRLSATKVNIYIYIYIGGLSPLG